MSYSAYVGLSGSGKSYNAVEHVIIPAAKKGQQVWTNIPLNLDLMEKDFGVRPTVFETNDIKEDPNWFTEVLPKGACLVLDEIQMIFPSGMKATAINDSQKEFFTQYRHRVGEDGFSTEFVLLTQDLQNVCAFVRNLIGVTYRHVKMEHLGASNRFNVHIYQGSVTGPAPSERTKTGKSGPHKYKAEVYKYYQSATQSDSGGVGDESRSDNRISIWRSWKTWAFMAACPALLGFGYVTMTSFYQNMFGDPEAEAVEVKNLTSNGGQSGSSQPDRAGPQPARKPKEPEPFGGYKIYVYSNIGVFPRIEYKFLVENKDSRTVLDLQQVRRVGYSVTPITQCMVKVQWQESVSRMVLCQKEQTEQQGHSITLPGT